MGDGAVASPRLLRMAGPVRQGGFQHVVGVEIVAALLRERNSDRPRAELSRFPRSSNLRQAVGDFRVDPAICAALCGPHKRTGSRRPDCGARPAPALATNQTRASTGKKAVDKVAAPSPPAGDCSQELALSPANTGTTSGARTSLTPLLRTVTAGS